MKIGEFSVGHLSHVSFLFRSPQGTIVLTDPLFAKGFMWKGHYEFYLSPPLIALEEITRCDAIFVSHIHGDHYDPPAIQYIHERTKARILAPEDVLGSLRCVGVSDKYLVHIEDGVEIRINDVELTPLTGYDPSLDTQGRPNKFSLIVEAGISRLFYSGDCHRAPPGLKGKRVDAIFLWPHPDDKVLLQFHENVEFSKLVLMHGDHFEPGSFLCNLGYSVEKERIHRLLPTVEVIIPERIARVGDDFS